MKELVVISGKGGTGKTSIVASFAALSKNFVFADCDVDAADLHILLHPQIRLRESFTGGKKARILAGHCNACGKCEELCRFDAIFYDGPGNGIVAKTFRIDDLTCEGCGVCSWFCEEKAIALEDEIVGQLFISDTRYGPMVHAKLGIAQENSGKLVSFVRQRAREVAENQNLNYLLIDGSPGIGCPVIASITGASLVLAVVEPTLSGMHDMERVFELVKHFCAVCINKWDLNERLTSQIEDTVVSAGAKIAGRIRYDKAVVEAHVMKKNIIEYNNSSRGIKEEVESIFNVVIDILERK